MLALEKIANAFTAIVEEAEKLQPTASEEVKKGLDTIINIAKHQSDIRGATECPHAHKGDA